ncbi:MAG: glucose-1-phosphate adenylyltransferase [Deltaproteobacteria bacterium]|nr:glucose-1-phosphate adenylyltransferase [Deltaproteobacteria bacterium]
MSKTIAMVLAGARVDEMAALTERRPKSAVVFGGNYRIIDCVLTNLVESGIEIVGLLPQYRFYSLIEHIDRGAPWDLLGRTRALTVLPPFQDAADSDWYRGSADALYQNLDFIERHDPDDVMILSADHIYRMDYRPLLRLHAEMNAEMTMGFTPVAAADASRFGIGQLDASGRVVEYAEKPSQPRANLASMTVYLFKRQMLIDELRQHARTGRPSNFRRVSAPWDPDAPQVSKTFQIYDEIVPRVVARGHAYGVVHEGIWEYTRTLDAYFQLHEEILSGERIDLDAWNLRTNTYATRKVDPAPTRFGPDARVIDSLVCMGCRIEGQVIRSVLSPDVVVGRGAVVKDSVLWHGTHVGPDAQLDKVVTDKFVRIGSGARVGTGDVTGPNQQFPSSLTCGATVIGRQAEVPDGQEVMRNCVIYPRVQEEHYGGERLETGQTLRPAPMGGSGKGL